MSKIMEFKGINELNDYLADNPPRTHWEVVPISRMFENPTTKLLTSTMTYVLILE